MSTTVLTSLSGIGGAALAALGLILSSVAAIWISAHRRTVLLARTEADRHARELALKTAQYEAETYRMLALREQDRLDRISAQVTLPYAEMEEIVKASARRGGRKTQAIPVAAEPDVEAGKPEPDPIYS